MLKQILASVPGSSAHRERALSRGVEQQLVGYPPEIVASIRDLLECTANHSPGSWRYSATNRMSLHQELTCCTTTATFVVGGLAGPGGNNMYVSATDTLSGKQLFDIAGTSPVAKLAYDNLRRRGLAPVPFIEGALQGERDLQALDWRRGTETIIWGGDIGVGLRTMASALRREYPRGFCVYRDAGDGKGLQIYSGGPIK